MVSFSPDLAPSEHICVEVGRQLYGKRRPLTVQQRQAALVIKGARCTSVVRAFAHGVMGRRIDPSCGGPTELFLVPASVSRLVYQRPWYTLSRLWNGSYKRTLAANRK